MKKKTSNLSVPNQQLSPIDGTKAYIELRKKIVENGILNRSYDYYTFLSLLTFFGLFFSIYEIIITPISVLLIVWCLALAFFTVQVGGLVHDAGHRAITKSTKINDILGKIFGSIIVMEYDTWNFTHNKHHAHTNQEDEDPDLEVPLHAFTQKRFMQEKGISRFLRRYQVYTYFPLRTFAGFVKRIHGLEYFIKERRSSVWAILAWCIGFCIWFIVPFFIFPLPKALLVFFLVHLGTGFYFSNIFAPNHKGMPELPKDAKISFLEHQIMTSRNIYGHWLTDYVFMGLNYQIEHHLFPNCPRNKLKEITPFVLDICRKMKLEYTQVGVLESNKIILATLQEVALSAENNK